ncbi:ABC transporter substrate-binding protein [Methanocella sp. CWC-04]|uniref:ABC transporter substrate-binding protein n=1 Tax=Methanooceanicella nereidis TaxID=2052831 RepID=A0AAP2RFB9_9EURY|nr:ABC transporter substrate-binding protein [Methanocella sp. CWC-04]MCD1296349.1 ABC transporter substrate-binding protein [Methanocella sp. CWC-04]
MDLKKQIAIVALLVILITAMCGCTQTNDTSSNTTSAKYPMEITDDYGRVTTITKAPEKIVSLTPANTEILFALGLGDKVVGNTDYCNYPEEAKSKTKVGGITNVNVEQIAALDPDVIFAGSLSKEDMVAKLDSMGYKTIAQDPRNVTGIKQTIMMIADVCDVKDNATRLIEDMDTRVAKVTDITSKMNESEKPKVLMVVWHDPVYVAGSNCYGDDIIKLAGGINAASGIEDYGVMNTEAIIEANPDVIIVTIGEGMDVPYDYFKNATEPWLKDINAIKNGRVYGIDSDTISRAGPRLPDAVEAMAKAIYPELFN